MRLPIKNESTIIAIIVSIPPTLAVCASIVVSLVTSDRQGDYLQKQGQQLREIHILTNTNFSKAMEKIDRLEAIIKAQEKENRELEENG